MKKNKKANEMLSSIGRVKNEAYRLKVANNYRDLSKVTNPYKAIFESVLIIESGGRLDKKQYEECTGDILRSAGIYTWRESLRLNLRGMWIKVKKLGR